MKARTPEEFVEKVSQDLAWRKKELSDHRMWVKTAENKLTQSRAIRAALTILYAHWEGFVRFSASLYIDFVAVRRLRCCDLAPNFVALVVRDRISQGNRDLFSKAMSLVRFFSGPLHERLKTSGEQVIQTKSNLGSDVLRDIVEVLGLDYSPYELKQRMIDSSLLDRRNRIAHGYVLDITPQAFYELHDGILELMQVFQGQLEDAVVNGYYRARQVA